MSLKRLLSTVIVTVMLASSFFQIPFPVHAFAEIPLVANDDTFSMNIFEPITMDVMANDTGENNFKVISVGDYDYNPDYNACSAYSSCTPQIVTDANGQTVLDFYAGPYNMLRDNTPAVTHVGFSYTLGDDLGQQTTGHVDIELNLVHEGPVSQPDGPYSAFSGQEWVIDNSIVTANDNSPSGNNPVGANCGVSDVASYAAYTIPNAASYFCDTQIHWTPPVDFTGQVKLPYVPTDSFGAPAVGPNREVLVQEITVNVSAPTGNPPVNTKKPVLSGQNKLGATLTVTNGTWTNSPTSFQYIWHRCTTTINDCVVLNSTGNTHVLANDDQNKNIYVTVVAYNAGGNASADSNTKSFPIITPINIVPPQITGQALRNQTLTLWDNGIWDNSPTFTYRWQRCDINGANCTNTANLTTSYTLAKNDVGFRMQLVVTGKNTAGKLVVNSNLSDVVLSGAPVQLSPVYIDGTPMVDQILTGTPGTWDGAPTFKFHWQRCDTSDANCIQVGAQSTYKLKAADIGLKIKLVIDAINSLGKTTVSADQTVGPVADLTPLPEGASLSIGDVTVTAPSAGSSATIFVPVSPSLILPRKIKATYTFTDLTAKNNTDYTASATGKLIIQQASAGSYIKVLINGSDSSSGVKYFQIDLTSSDIQVTDPVATIQINYTPEGVYPSLIKLPRTIQGIPLEVPTVVTRKGSLSSKLNYSWNTVNGKATSPQKFIAASGVGRFAIDQATKIIRVATVGGTTDARGEDFGITIQPDQSPLLTSTVKLIAPITPPTFASLPSPTEAPGGTQTDQAQYLAHNIVTNPGKDSLPYIMRALYMSGIPVAENGKILNDSPVIGSMIAGWEVTQMADNSNRPILLDDFAKLVLGDTPTATPDELVDFLLKDLRLAGNGVSENRNRFFVQFINQLGIEAGQSDLLGTSGNNDLFITGLQAELLIRRMAQDATVTFNGNVSVAEDLPAVNQSLGARGPQTGTQDSSGAALVPIPSGSMAKGYCGFQGTNEFLESHFITVDQTALAGSALTKQAIKLLSPNPAPAQEALETLISTIQLGLDIFKTAYTYGNLTVDFNVPGALIRSENTTSDGASSQVSVRAYMDDNFTSALAPAVNCSRYKYATVGLSFELPEAGDLKGGEAQFRMLSNKSLKYSDSDSTTFETPIVNGLATAGIIGLRLPEELKQDATITENVPVSLTACVKPSPTTLTDLPTTFIDALDTIKNAATSKKYGPLIAKGVILAINNVCWYEKIAGITVIQKKNLPYLTGKITYHHGDNDTPNSHYSEDATFNINLINRSGVWQTTGSSISYSRDISTNVDWIDPFTNTLTCSAASTGSASVTDPNDVQVPHVNFNYQLSPQITGYHFLDIALGTYITSTGTTTVTGVASPPCPYHEIGTFTDTTSGTPLNLKSPCIPFNVDNPDGIQLGGLSGFLGAWDQPSKKYLFECTDSVTHSTISGFLKAGGGAVPSN